MAVQPQLIPCCLPWGKHAKQNAFAYHTLVRMPGIADPWPGEQFWHQAYSPSHPRGWDFPTPREAAPCKHPAENMPSSQLASKQKLFFDIQFCNLLQHELSIFVSSTPSSPPTSRLVSQPASWPASLHNARSICQKISINWL